LNEIVQERGESLQHLINNIDADRQSANLSSVIRVFVLRHYMDQFARQREIFRQYLFSRWPWRLYPALAPGRFKDFWKD